MNDKEKIKIIADNLRKYLNKWKNEADNLNSFYYLATANLRIYEDYLKGYELDKEEKDLIKEALGFKEIKFGEFKHKF
jgi:hypothetical protein